MDYRLFNLFCSCISLLYGVTMDNVVQCSYLVVYVQIISHKFSLTPYYTHKHHRKSIHDRIKDLRTSGYGYRKIHKVLVREKFKIGKSPTTVDHMIKKMDRRERILNQKDVLKIVKVDIEVIKD